ncbi:MAG: glutamyl-tRNA reductase [Blastocatellia bacterium]|nr:glutamyl-tRNA reductase [Blastocatellia bacterium]MCS7157474.1 glutamyl-tRNA reductase [Blastocatellia bacterium]MCX7752647.1 glutamyl-tRNA reductase [Blastocatellia bacterium]MDW8168378.1 glutamyl-tRNA reductase [Acidobacteriota bacterium]MDW8255574.1 glutamyl-tRNA reductase [Acidobacteriota bacterium]
MTIVLVGLNHRTAPVEVRERLAFTEEELPQALRQLVDGQTITEGLILSTCNRVEVLAVTPLTERAAVERIRAFLRERHRIPPDAYEAALYRYVDRDAVRHVFRVTASLDSMVLGEPQIFGQVKEAYAQAVAAGTVGKTLNLLLPRAFSVAKRVRTETAIGTEPVSVSSVAVELARKIFEDLNGRTVLLIGAGKMAELTVRHLLAAGVQHLLISNRTRERAEQLAAQFGAEALSLDVLPIHLARADIVICSVGGTEYVLRREQVAAAMPVRRNRPLFLIDISVPRMIEPGVGHLENVFLYDIDDLEQIVHAHLEHRRYEAARAEVIVDQAVEEFLTSLRRLEVGPLIAAFRRRLEEIAYGELERHRPYLGRLTPEQERALRHLLDGIINKFAHPAISRLHQAAREGALRPEELSFLKLWEDIVDAQERRSSSSSE